MIQSYKKILMLFMLCLTISSCSDQEKINSLQDRLSSCQAQSNYNYSAWENKKDEFEKCLTINNNLYTFVDEKGTYLDKTAKFFTISPWLSLLYGLVLLVIASAFSFFGIGSLLSWRHSAKHKEAEKIIKSSKEARQAILEASDKLTHTQDEINALEAQKTTILSELEELKQYQNIDELQEKAKIIAKAKEEANSIFTANISKIKAQATKFQAELDQERAEIDEKWENLNQKEQELEQKYKELEEIRQTMIDG